jgi:TonB-dependent receptor
MLKSLALVAGVIAGMVSAFGQYGISGKVTDGSSYLTGVSVQLKRGDKLLTTISDPEGYFQFTNLASGTYQLSASMVGFLPREVGVVVQDRSLSGMSIALTEVMPQLKAVVVGGNSAPSQIRALSIKKHALSFMDVLAADAIGKLPDRNAAEAVQRLPAVSVNRYHGEANTASVRGTPYAWSSTLYNGTRLPSANFGNRNTALDAIPAEMIQYIQLSKVITPEMEGDAIGGSINFITRSTPAKRTLNASAAIGYNEKARQETHNFSLVYGDRFLKNKLGFIVAASQWKRNFSADEVVVEYNLAATNAAQRNAINTINAKRYLGYRNTTAVNLAAEYEFSSRHRIFGRFVNDYFDDVRPVTESFYELSRRRYRYSYRYSFYETALKGLEAGGQHRWSDRFKSDWRVSDYDMTYTLNTPPGMPQGKRGLPIAQFYQSLTGNFGNRSADGLIYNAFDATDRVGIDPLAFNPKLTSPTTDVIDPAKLRLTQMIIFQLDQRDHDRVYMLNNQFDLAPRFQLRFGAKYRSKEFSGMQTPLVYLANASLGIPGSAPMKTLSQLQTEPFRSGSTYFKEIGNPFPNFMINPITKDQLFSIFTPDFFTTQSIADYSAASNPTTRYEGTENVTAGYLMGVFDVSDVLKIIAGVRNERTDIVMNSTQYDNVTKKLAPVRKESSYNAFLPSLQFKYTPVENLNLRLAYTRTFSRANLPDLSPSEIVDVTGGQARITRGNTLLKPTFSDNVDLTAEWFLSDIGQVTAGVFHKSISNYIFRDLSIESIGGTSYFVTQPKNLKGASLLGMEAGISKRFSKWKGFWGGFGLDVNASLIRSNLDVPRYNSSGQVVATDKTSLPNQSSLLFNTSVFYEKYGVTVRMAGNYRGRSVESINQNLGPDYYLYVDNNFTVDVSAAYSINDHLKVFSEVRNITNEPFRQYMGNNPARITNHEWFSVNGQAGIRWSL